MLISIYIPARASHHNAALTLLYAVRLQLLVVRHVYAEYKDNGSLGSPGPGSNFRGQVTLSFILQDEVLVLHRLVGYLCNGPTR